MYNIVIIHNFGATCVLFHCSYIQWNNTSCSKVLNDYNTIYIYIYTRTYIYKIHFTRNTSSNLPIYSTNVKISKDFNTILGYFICLSDTFYWNKDVDSSRMITKCHTTSVVGGLTIKHIGDFISAINILRRRRGLRVLQVRLFETRCVYVFGVHLNIRLFLSVTASWSVPMSPV